MTGPPADHPDKAGRNRFHRVRARFRRRTVHQVFRVSAVRRPATPSDQAQAAERPPQPSPGKPAWERPFGRWFLRVLRRSRRDRESPEDEEPTVPVRVSDEELIHALWAAKGRLEERLAEELLRLKPECTVVAVSLEDLRPGGSVLMRLHFVVHVTGSAVSAVMGASAAVIVAVASVLEQELETPVAVSAAPEPAAATLGGTQRSAWDRVAPVLAVIGTGVGVIGFVTFVGGLIVWARLRAAGFPATPALGIFPNQDLLVIGAQTLVPQMLVALGFVAVLGVIYVLLRAVIDRVGEEEAALVAGQATRLGALGMFGFVSVALVLSVLPFLDEIDANQLFYAGLLVLFGATLAAAIGSVTRGFVYLVTATFVLVGIFLGFVAYWRASNKENVRGAAIIRENKKAIAGIFVAEGAGRVYLARTKIGDNGIVEPRSRLVGIAKTQITDIAIAGEKPPESAVVQARHLAKELCELQPRRAPPERGGIENCRTAGPGRAQP